LRPDPEAWAHDHNRRVRLLLRAARDRSRPRPVPRRVRGLSPGRRIRDLEGSADRRPSNGVARRDGPTPCRRPSTGCAGVIPTWCMRRSRPQSPSRGRSSTKSAISSPSLLSEPRTRLLPLPYSPASDSDIDPAARFETRGIAVNGRPDRSPYCLADRPGDALGAQT